MRDLQGSGQLMMDDVISGLVVQGSVRKQGDEAMWNKPVLSLLCSLCVSSCLQVVALFEFLLSLLLDCYMDCEWNRPFPLKVALVMVFHHSNSNPKIFSQLQSFYIHQEEVDRNHRICHKGAISGHILVLNLFVHSLLYYYPFTSFFDLHSHRYVVAHNSTKISMSNC